MVARALGLLLLAAAFAVGADPDLAAAAKKPFANVRTHTLANGLKVYLVPMDGAATVTTMVAYKVGSADEAKDQTGLSHYLEHLLFKGTDKLFPGDIDRATQRNGGRNNAYTNEDMTVYHFDFAADRWEKALEIEADRMRNVRIDAKHEFEQEKGAVIAELKGGEDRPWELEMKAILPLLYPTSSPYSHPVIGEEQHVRAATAEIIKRYYDQWYYPNNASLIVAGGFDPDAALKTIEAKFATIPKGDLPMRREFGAVPLREKPVRKEFASKFDVPRVLVGFNGVPAGHADEAALDVLAGVLSNGKTSRLYRKLVEGTQLAAAADTYHSTGRYPGWFAVLLEVLPGKDRAEAEKVLFAELARSAAEAPSEAELKRVKRTLLAQFVFNNETPHELADSVARAVTNTNLDELRGRADRLQAVTAVDVQRVAAKYLAPNTATIVASVPPMMPKGGAEPGAKPEKPRRLAAAPAAGLGLAAATRKVLPNGLTLVLLPDRRLPVVAAAVQVADVKLNEPADRCGILAMVGDMLEEGTDQHTAEQIATLVEDTGGSFSVGSTGGRLKMLTPDAKTGLSLLFECLARPTFAEDRLAVKREQRLADILNDETEPLTRARRLFAATVYGAHPAARPAGGVKEVVEKLTAADLKAFHTQHYGPDATTAVIVGDFEIDEMTNYITALTKDWKPIGYKPAKVPPPPVPEKPITKIVSDPSAAQTHVLIGHVGITRKDEDYYTLLVMDNVLGTGPGFTDRLSANLRDRQGLAYTVRATIADSASDQPGAFTGYVGTFPEKFIRVREGFLAEFNKIRSEEATAVEVGDAKAYLLGSLPFRVESLDDRAGELLAAERYKLGYDFLDGYRAKVAAVTPAMVKAAAAKHLDPKRLVIVAVGPIDAEGKALAPAPEKKGSER
jgi:zinc protease